MALIQEKQIFYINSENRVSGTYSDFKHTLDIAPNTNFDTAVILNMSIPKSYYLVQNNYNTFTLDEINLTATITVPAGNYTRTSFKTTLQNLLTSNSPNGWSYTVSFPPSTSVDTGKYTYSVSGNGGVQPKFILDTNSATLFGPMGFDSHSTNVFNADTLISTNVINLQAETALFLHSDLIGNNKDDILQEVYGVDDLNFSNIVYSCTELEAYSKPLASKAGNIARFYITNENNVLMDLNGQNVVFTLMLYKKDNIYNILKNMIKLALLN